MAQQLGSLEKVLRFGEGRRLKRLAEQAAYIGTLEPEFEQLSDAELAGKTVEFRQRIENGEPVSELVFEAFAAVREAFKRTMDVRLFDVQQMGGIVLHEGDIAEMKTGEGKTFVAVQPLYLNALTGKSAHLVTVNDYLAKRDPEWTKPVWEALGMRASYIQNMMPFDERREAYAADVVYGTNSEFGFDYLRDNMAVSLEGLVQRGHDYAIVDEVDSILIDEARTPLIISGEPEIAAQVYYDFARIARGLVGHQAKPGDPNKHAAEDAGADYEYDEKHKTVSPMDGAIEQVERALKIDNLYDPRNGQLVNHLNQALKAQSLFQRDVDYVVQDGEVKIVDEFTGPDHGRPALVGGPAPGRRGEGGREHPGGARHARDDHAAELLPPLRQARRHDRHRQDRGEGVRRDLRPPRRRDPDQRRCRARRQERPDLQDRPRRSTTPSSRTSRSGTRRASRSSSARSPSRSRSTSRSCSSARASRTTS